MAPAPVVLLPAATHLTRRIRLGPCVYCLPLYAPLRLIEEICMLDQMSQGRFDLGVGRGIVPYEMAYFDLHPFETEEIYREALEVILAGLTNDVLEHRGPRYTYRRRRVGRHERRARAHQPSGRGRDRAVRPLSRGLA